jgi:hypothetical protein
MGREYVDANKISVSRKRLQGIKHDPRITGQRRVSCAMHHSGTVYIQQRVSPKEGVLYARGL